MAQSPTSSAVRALQLELKKIQEEPVEGFRVRLVNDDNIFEWEVAIFGPPGTLYEAGYFKVRKTLLHLCYSKILRLPSTNGIYCETAYMRVKDDVFVGPCSLFT